MTSDIPASVGLAFLHHLTRQSSTSAVRSLGDHFVYSMITVHEARHPQLPFFIPLRSPFRDQLKIWFERLPKTLWELGNRDEEATEGLLRFLLEVGLRGQAGFVAPFSLLDTSVSRAIPLNLGWVADERRHRPFRVWQRSWLRFIT